MSRYEAGDALPPEWTESLDGPKPHQVEADAFRLGFEAGRKWERNDPNRQRIEQLKEWVSIVGSIS